MSSSIDMIARSLSSLQQPGVDTGIDTGARQIPLPGVALDGPSFGDTLTGVINSISEARNHAGAMTRRFVAGEDVELHQVMAAQEESGVALDLLIEMRNKMVESYRTLINMQS